MVLTTLQDYRGLYVKQHQDSGGLEHGKKPASISEEIIE